MGEYANYNGNRIKIGTCESMYYLRFDQRHMVTASETPLFDPEVLAQIRFRFPFPAEDAIEPGDFEYTDRGVTLHGFEQPKEVEHGSVQFKADNGYLVSLPCPEGPDADPRVGKNGYGGPCDLVEQGLRDGQLVGIVRCKGCRTLYRLCDGYEEAAAVAIRAMADRQARTNDAAYGGAARLHETADRLLAGYAPKAQEVR